MGQSGTTVMVAPKYGPTESPSSEVVNNGTSRKSDKRRREILSRLVSDASEDRMEGNKLFKDRHYDRAVTKYSKAIHTLQKVRDRCPPGTFVIRMQYFSVCAYQSLLMGSRRRSE